MSPFSSFEIRFSLKGINTLYYRETGKYFATLVVRKQFGFRFLKKPSTVLIRASLRTKRGRLIISLCSHIVVQN